MRTISKILVGTALAIVLGTILGAATPAAADWKPDSNDGWNRTWYRHHHRRHLWPYRGWGYRVYPYGYVYGYVAPPTVYYVPRSYHHENGYGRW